MSISAPQTQLIIKQNADFSTPSYYQKDFDNSEKQLNHIATLALKIPQFSSLDPISLKNYTFTFIKEINGLLVAFNHKPIKNCASNEQNTKSCSFLDENRIKKIITIYTKIGNKCLNPLRFYPLEKKCKDQTPTTNIELQKLYQMAQKLFEICTFTDIALDDEESQIKNIEENLQEILIKFKPPLDNETDFFSEQNICILNRLFKEEKNSSPTYNVDTINDILTELYDDQTLEKFYKTYGLTGILTVLTTLSEFVVIPSSNGHDKLYNLKRVKYPSNLITPMRNLEAKLVYRLESLANTHPKISMKDHLQINILIKLILKRFSRKTHLSQNYIFSYSTLVHLQICLCLQMIDIVKKYKRKILNLITELKEFTPNSAAAKKIISLIIIHQKVNQESSHKNACEVGNILLNRYLQKSSFKILISNLKHKINRLKYELKKPWLLITPGF